MPRVHQALDTLQGKNKYFLTFDLLKAYWQFPVRKDTRKYLTFSKLDDLYEWLRMPFRIAGAPAVQRQMLNSLVAGVKWISALAYLNDIVIYSKTFKKHSSHLEPLFKRCAKGSNNTTYLGFIFIVSTHSFKLNPKEIKFILKYPVSTDRETVAILRHRQVQTFFYVVLQGRRTYYNNLCYKRQNLCGVGNRRKLFLKIKQAISTATLMRHPDPTEPFIFDCDAFLKGLGAALHQRDERSEKYYVAFASRTVD